jgi:hypothetical protein
MRYESTLYILMLNKFKIARVCHSYINTIHFLIFGLKSSNGTEDKKAYCVMSISYLCPWAVLEATDANPIMTPWHTIMYFIIYNLK